MWAYDLVEELAAVHKLKHHVDLRFTGSNLQRKRLVSISVTHTSFLFCFCFCFFFASSSKQTRFIFTVIFSSYGLNEIFLSPALVTIITLHAQGFFGGGGGGTRRTRCQRLR